MADNNYIFSNKIKLRFLGISMLGILLITFSFLIETNTGERIWMNILLNNLFFLFISLFGSLFIALHSIALSGWHISLKTNTQKL